MRAVQLIGCQVVDRDGVAVGRVHDLRLVTDPHRRGLSGYHLDGLVTGTGSVGNRLGYTTDDVRGPWPLPQLFRRLCGTVHVVPWREVAAVDGRVIRLRVDVAGLGTGRPGTGRPGTGRLGTGRPRR